MDGIDAAKAELKTMAEMFSFAADWPMIFSEATEYLLEQKRQADQAEAEHKQRMAQAWIDAIAKNGFSGQLNFLPGDQAKAPYYSSPMGGDKQ